MNARPNEAEALDQRFMLAAIRLSKTHLALTGTNPSVATLLVRDGAIVGRGVTALGGRPHAETIALQEAGPLARGCTAYVTLEPCAHHGRTPPCAQALIDAGVARVVCALHDLDDRVAGKGFAMMREAGIEVAMDVCADAARDVLGDYLRRTATRQAQILLKLAVSQDGMIGSRQQRQLAITGALARAYGHRLRAASDAIMIGVGTALIDDPMLNCRLPGLKARSPVRIVVDTHARLPLASQLVRTAREIPTWVVTADAVGGNARALQSEGVTIIAAECHDKRIALPELMEDLAARGLTSILVEGGAELAASLLGENLVSRVALFRGDGTVGAAGVRSPFDLAKNDRRFVLDRGLELGQDQLEIFRRT